MTPSLGFVGLLPGVRLFGARRISEIDLWAQVACPSAPRNLDLLEIQDRWDRCCGRLSPAGGP